MACIGPDHFFFRINKAKKMPKNLQTGKKPYLCTAFEQMYWAMV